MGTFGRSQWWSGSFWLAWVYSRAPSRRRVHSGSRVFTAAVLGFIWFCVGSLDRTKASLGSFAFAWFHSGVPSCVRVYSGATSSLSGFAWVHSGAPRCSFGSRGFTSARIVFIRVQLGSLWRAEVSSVSFGIAWVHSITPSGGWVNFGSCGSLRRL